jgi:hypothetical protein
MIRVVAVLAVALAIGCGPNKKAKVDARPPDPDGDPATYQTCDPSWCAVIPPTTTCQTPCVDMSNLGEVTGCMATSPINGATITCDPNLMTMFAGRHGCCFFDMALDPNHVRFADCQ